jgi:hypothetical protein
VAIPEKKISNRQVVKIMSKEFILAFLVAFAGIVATYTTLGNSIHALDQKDTVHEDKMEKLEKNQEKITEKVNETNLNVIQIKTEQRHVAESLRRILEKLED